MSIIRKLINFEVKEIGDPADRTLRFVGSDETVDRDEDIIMVDGWILDSYRKNPVIMFGHDYREPAVGKAVNVIKDVENKQLIFDVKFPTLEELSSDVNNASEHAKFIDTVYNLYKQGYMKATSVGFIPKKWKRRDDEESQDKPEYARGRIYTEQELLELSLVPVPCNPNALELAKSKGIEVDPVERAIEQAADKGTVPRDVSRSTAAEDTDWQAPTLSDFTDQGWDDLTDSQKRNIAGHFGWAEKVPPERYGDLKLPHHRPSDGSVVWRGVAAAMAALMGARGGVDIPDGDRRAVYNHLASHYRQFDKEPPEFEAAEPQKEGQAVEWAAISVEQRTVEYWKCPRCDAEVGDHELVWDQEKGCWYHTPCKEQGPVVTPDDPSGDHEHLKQPVSKGDGLLETSLEQRMEEVLQALEQIGQRLSDITTEQATDEPGQGDDGKAGEQDEPVLELDEEEKEPVLELADEPQNNDQDGDQAGIQADELKGLVQNILQEETRKLRNQVTGRVD